MSHEQQTYLHKVDNLLTRIFGMQLASHGKKAALAAKAQGKTPGQVVLFVAQNDGLQPV